MLPKGYPVCLSENGNYCNKNAHLQLPLEAPYRATKRFFSKQKGENLLWLNERAKTCLNLQRNSHFFRNNVLIYNYKKDIISNYDRHQI